MKKLVNNKMILIFSLLLLFFVIGTVSAADNGSNCDNGVDADVLTVSSAVEDEIVLADESVSDNFTSLNNIINDASENSTIELTKNYVFNNESDSELADGINISKNLIIDGKGFTIDGNNTARIFFLIGNLNITFTNITFVNAGNNAIFVNNDTEGFMEVTDSLFINNHALDSGGAIEIKRSSETESFLKASIRNSLFIGNTADRYGGAVCMRKGIIDNCTFQDNYAREGGAIILHSEGIIVSNSNFENNSAVSAGASYNLAINCTYENCTFNNNHANNSGGVIWFRGDARCNLISNCNFTNNTAGINGGVIYTSTDFGTGEGNTVFNCVFDNNSALNNGDGLYVVTQGFSVINSTFINTVNETDLIVSTKSICLENNTGVNLSDVVLPDGQLFLMNRDFYISPDGTGNGTSVEDCANWTYAYSNIASAKTIYLTSGTYFDIINQTIEKPLKIVGNDAIIDLNGTGYAFNIPSVQVVISNITFQNALSFIRKAGCIEWNGANGMLSDCIFINNTGIINDIYHSDNLVLNNNTFYGSYINIPPFLISGYEYAYITVDSDNEDMTADFYLNGDYYNSITIPANITSVNQIDLNNLSFNEDYVISVEFITQTSNKFYNTFNNTFRKFDSLTIYLSPDGEGKKDGFTPENADSADNISQYLYPGYSIVLLNGTYYNIDCIVPDNMNITGSGNTIIDVQNNGRAFRIDGDNVTIKNINFKDFLTNNVNGGAVYWNGINGCLADCTFTNPSTVSFKGNGGAVYWAGSYGSIYNSTFTNIKNTQYGDSGLVIYASSASSYLNVSNCKFTNISGIDIDSFEFLGSYSVIDNCLFESCSNGRQLMRIGQNANITNTVFNNCNSTYNGIICRWNEGNVNLNVINCNFTSCTKNPGIIGREYWGGKFNGFNFTNCTFNNSRIISNKAVLNNLTIENCVFIGTTGNEIFSSVGNDNKVLNSNFTNVRIVLNGDNCTVDNCNFNITRNNFIPITWSGANGTLSGSSIISTSNALQIKWNGTDATIMYNAFIPHDNQNYQILDITETANIGYNWYGNNTPDLNTLQNNCSDATYLIVMKNSDEIIGGEWNEVLDICFVKNGTDEIVDTPIRPIDYTLNQGDIIIKDPFTGHMKIYSDKTNQTINITAKVDNQLLGDFIYEVNNNNSFRELQTLINKTKAGGILVLNNNYTYNPDNEQLINGVTIDKPITIALNGSSISGNNTAKNVFNIISEDVILENITIKDVNGTAITAVGDNIQINNLIAENTKGTVINITGDNAKITNVNIPEEKIIVNGILNISVAADDVLYSDTATVYINAGVDGTYTLKINGEKYNITVKNGTASKVLDVLSPGTYDASVSGKFGKKSPVSTATANFSVIDITLPEIVENKTTEVPLDLPSDATGNVSITVDGEVVDSQEVINGSVVLEIPELDAGQYNITIIYPGDDEHVAFNKTFNATVKVDTNTNLTLPEIIENETVDIPVDLPSDATGNISVIVDGEVVDSQELVNGSTVLEIPELDAGHHNISIIYPGDDKYASFNITSDVPVKVDGEFNVTVPDLYENVTAEIPVDLPEDATGNVSLIVDDELVDTKELVNGSAILEIPALSKGEHNITVIYPGDDKYASQTDDYNVTVVDDLIISSNNLTKYYSAPDRFIITVTDSKGNPFVNKTVTITLNGKNYTRHTDENGSANLAINLNPGEYDAIVTADNVTFNHTITVLSTINGTDVVKVFRNGTQYYVTLRDNNGNLLPEGSEVEFNINGVIYTHKTDENGTAKLNINLDQGNYIITTTNLNTSESRSNNITVLSRFTNNTDIVKYYKNGTQYSVTLLGDDGNPVGAGVDVVFNINGVLYTRQTNDEGVAKLNINLQPGNYIITAMDYYDCRVSNNIEVLPTLVGEDLVKNYGDSSQFVATVYDNTGNAYPNQNVTFNINGVFYNTRSDSNGQAKLNINLPKGEYIITSSYNDYNVANKITIH